MCGPGVDVLELQAELAAAVAALLWNTRRTASAAHRGTVRGAAVHGVWGLQPSLTLRAVKEPSGASAVSGEVLQSPWPTSW